MTTATQCDGCKQLVEGDAELIGHDVKHDYCEDCAPVAKQMLTDIDALHDKLASDWDKSLSKIKSKYRKKLLSIPDEQDA